MLSYAVAKKQQETICAWLLVQSVLSECWYCLLLTKTQ